MIVDASVAVKLIVAEPGTVEARELCFAQATLAAPDWLVIEAASAIWGKVMRGEVLASDAPTLNRALPPFFETLHPSRALLDEGMRLAIDLRHHVYDCIYLGLALREGQQLVTADKAFVASARRAGFDEHVQLLSWNGA